MLRPHVMVVMVCLIGCSESQPTSTGKPQTVNPRDLYNSYVDGADRWTNQTVRIVLPRKSYFIADGKILWHHARTTDSPSILFTPSGNVTSDESTIEIVGVCRGKREDNGARSSGRKWHVAVDSCVIAR